MADARTKPETLGQSCQDWRPEARSIKTDSANLLDSTNKLIGSEPTDGDRLLSPVSKRKLLPGITVSQTYSQSVKPSDIRWDNDDMMLSESSTSFKSASLTTSLDCRKRSRQVTAFREFGSNQTPALT
jgi:hypothetical protein